MDENKILKWIFSIFALILIGLEFVALGMDSHYKYDFIFLMILLTVLYAVREKIHLHWSHYLVFSLFLLVHDLGMFDLYRMSPLGIEYDHWVHILFGFIAALMIMRFYQYSDMPHKKAAPIIVILLVLGFSAAHELYEFTGAILLGEGEGVLFIGAGDLDEWDTQKDMLNNLIGSIIGVVFYAVLENTGAKPEKKQAAARKKKKKPR